MQNCKSTVTMVFECYFFTLTSSCIVQVWPALECEMMMSVLQEVEGLTKELYFIILTVGRAVSMQNFRLHVCAVYLF